MASRAVDALITYRIIKLLVTPFERQEAFKYGQYIFSTLYNNNVQAASTLKTFASTIT